jgi:hypothetical protein
MSTEQPPSAQNKIETRNTLAAKAEPVQVTLGQSAEPAPRGAGPQKQLCLCAFRLDGTSKAGNIGGVIGGVGGAVAGSSHTHSYYGDINKEVQHVYETALRESGSFQYVDSEKLIGSEGGKPLSLADTAAKNKLFACASAKPYWSARVGWDKQVAIFTKWEIAGPGGCKLKFKTSVASEETYGKFPNGADPKLKPVYLKLSKEDAKQFPEAFQRAMEKAGCGQ